MKNGAPKNAVIIPTGSSVGEIIVRAIVSVHTKNIPPTNADEGIRTR